MVKLADMKAGDCFDIKARDADIYTWLGVNMRTNDGSGIEGDRSILCVQLEHGLVQLIPEKDQFEVVNIIGQILPDEEIQK